MTRKKILDSRTFKELFNLSSTLEVIEMLEKEKMSLYNVSFDVVKEFEKEDKFIQFVSEKNIDKRMSIEILYILSNKKNIPQDITSINPVSAFKMGLYAVKFLPKVKDAFFANEEFCKKITEFITKPQNTVLRTQFLPLMTMQASDSVKKQNLADLTDIQYNIERNHSYLSKEIDKTLLPIIMKMNESKEKKAKLS